ncbi:acetyl-CoA decarbonylase/synthase beta subunit [Methanothermus fervidus DSM 2088]|uniref:Acetyl-CoA decarbonylase/synthase complex subunit beta n=1 Tax=Methanothermus fervidus (strain ATCC 43054 / DSM 2088 / JCM 10308 / V24 S) TaxID=523846 RepID=E3GYE3_METFV|nr:CO dehydrogenase/CO-methylating acetyl-CoA synthase complex subunit beta [Methanothermus fervidus]ADP77325.1 acetyl-CoA decarbonylase/synthase beta subunit [Methanothermus fervidus DSM 2088]
MFENIPVNVGAAYEGERIRSANMFVELAGPKSIGAELVRVKEDVEDGRIKVIGPDLDEMKQGERHPFGIKIEIAGKDLEEDLEGVIERKIHELCNYVQGFMHLNQRDQIWCRVSVEAKEAGFRLKHLGEVLIALFKEEFNIIDKISVTLITDEEKVKEFVEEARKVYEKRDARVRELSEEDVDVFYGCVMCQSFAPTHVCIVTPDRPALCGAMNWFDCRAAHKIDPEGPIFEVEKGEVIDEIRGEYSGANDAVLEKSQGTIEKVYLHSVFEYPHTSCGCFEAIAFYIPELDGIGIVHRNYKGETPLGIPFSTMAGQCSGGKQVEGFCGLSIEYMRSPKFLRADGGYERIVWMPKEIKEMVFDFIPEELRDKIPTEEEAVTIEEIKEFLKEKGHPIVKRWKEEKEVTKEKKEEKEEAEETPAVYAPELALPTSGGVRIVLKNAKIYAEKIIIKKKK